MKNKSTPIPANPELEKTIDDLTLFDDDLMSKVFDKNVEAAELLLRIILERDDIKVIAVKGQVELKSPYPNGRNIKLDILAVDANDVRFNVEVQRSTKGSHIRRTRFHQGMIDSRLLKKKQDFKELTDTYIIFICQHDKFRQKKPIYHVDKIIRETGETFDDGAHIIYVNGKYRGEDAFGKLAHDFQCKKSQNMHYKPFADGIKHFKETEKGRKEMCELIEKYAEKRADEKSKQSRIDTLTQSVDMLMKNTSVSLEQAFINLGISDDDKDIISKKLKK